jgi:hypothetical protein
MLSVIIGTGVLCIGPACANSVSVLKNKLDRCLIKAFIELNISLRIMDDLIEVSFEIRAI